MIPAQDNPCVDFFEDPKNVKIGFEIFPFLKIQLRTQNYYDDLVLMPKKSEVHYRKYFLKTS